MIEMMIVSVLNNSVTREKQRQLQKIPFNPLELITLRGLSREELLAVMVFCDIRTLNGLPVAAMDDEELRMAYTLWRSDGQIEYKTKKRKFKRFIRQGVSLATQYLEGGLWR